LIEIAGANAVEQILGLAPEIFSFELSA